MNSYFQRAKILFEQHRFSDAEKELLSALSSDPNNLESNNLLAFIYAEQGKKTEALEAANRTISLAPDWSFAWYTFAYANWIQDKSGSSDNALKAINQAINLDPRHADYHYMKGEIHFSKKNWQVALDSAEEALALGAENIGALNLRAKSLVKLNRVADANDTLDFAIHQNPEDPNSHANKGWALIEKGEYDEALTHFKEALRIDPNNKWAREGLKNAIKGKNILYRGILKYFLWIAKQSEKNQWLFIIGAYVLYRGVIYLSQVYPIIAPVAYPIIGAYVAFAFSSWIAVPFSNIFLRMHPLGKHALSPFEIIGSNIIGGFLFGGLLSGLSYLLGGFDAMLFLAIWFLMMSIPLGATFSSSEPRPGTKKLIGLTTFIGLTGLTGIAGLVMLNNEQLFNICVSVFGLSILGFSFLANFLMNKRN
ncbi:MAG: tetratricopeptide (TPR) repeat protein [Maribacter sp.]|jgi:tetratricopeptide (TPR) repeat protein